MRCLYCNKKLSLLKLAKGDSYCSPEHFDAYQLQLSKNAYERLVSAPEDEAPKAPLKLKPVVQEHRVEAREPVEADAALARLTSFRSPEKAVAPPVQPALPPPPYAPFLSEPLPAVPPNPPVPAANDPEANEPVQTAGELALPVHDVQATEGILNLHLQLDLADAPALDWEAENPAAVPENFQGEVTRPLLAVPVEAQENAAPSEASAEPVVEAAPAIVEVHPVEPVVEAAPAIEAVLPVETPSPVEPETEVAATTQIEPATVEPEMQVEPQIQAEAEIHAEPELQAEPEIRVEPKIEVKADIRDEPEMEAEPRLPFLVAPSFRERSGDAAPFDDAASAAPNDWRLVPVLDLVPSRRPGWSGEVAQSTRFAGNISIQPKDAAGEPVESGFALPVETGLRLPEEKAIESYGWQVAGGPIGIARPPLEVRLVSTQPLDSFAPAPVPVRPAPQSAAAIDKGEILTAPAEFLFLGVLETRPRGQEPVFANPPADPMKLALPSILAAFPRRGPFSTATWQNQARHFSLPVTLADGTEAAKFTLQPVEYAPECIKQDAAAERKPSLKNLSSRSLAWPETDYALPPNADPIPAASEPGVCLLAPAEISNPLALRENPVFAGVFERDFTAASNVVIAGPDLPFVSSTRLPADGAIPFGDTGIGLCALTIEWEPSVPALRDLPAARFLPVRKGPIMPAARSWPRLGALPG